MAAPIQPLPDHNEVLRIWKLIQQDDLLYQQLIQTMTTKKEEKFYFNRVKVITRNENGTEVPYLIRRTLFAISKLFSIKIHKIILSDDVCTHDHPWPFFTILLKGGYYEWTPASIVQKGRILDIRRGSNGKLEMKRWYGPGSILYRPAEFIHQLELATDDTGRLIPATTFVITGKVIRRWGFITSKGWMHHTDYDKQRDC